MVFFCNGNKEMKPWKYTQEGGINMDKKKKIIQTDPQGSYTGRPEDETEIPVQDADDL